MPKILVADRDAALGRGEIPVDWYNPGPRTPTWGLHFVDLPTLMGGPRSGFCKVVSDHWWAVHPLLGGLMFGLNPQANADRVLTEKLIRAHYPGAQAQFIHKAFVPINPKDYA